MEGGDSQWAGNVKNNKNEDNTFKKIYGIIKIFSLSTTG